MPPGARARVDQRLERRKVGFEHLEELVDAGLRRARVAGGATVPVAVVRMSGGERGAVPDDAPPALPPVDLIHADIESTHRSSSAFCRRILSNLRLDWGPQRPSAPSAGDRGPRAPTE